MIQIYTTTLCCTAVSLALIAAPAMAELDTANLQNLLVQDCGSCHGLTMKGGLGPALLPANLAEKPDAILISTILDGRPGTAMPPWRGLLDEAEAEWITATLRRGL